MSPAVVMFVVFLLSNMASPMYPLWEESLGFPTETITLLFSLYQAGVLVGLLGFGRLIDGVGWRKSLIAATSFSLLASMVFAAATTPEALMAARLVSGVAAGVFVSCGSAAVSAVLERQGHGDATRVASLAISGGLAAGPLLSGLLADTAPLPTRLVFIVEAALLFVGAVALWRDAQLRAVGGARPPAARPVYEKERGGQDRPDRGLIAIATTIFTACYITCSIFMSIGSAYLQRALDVESAVLAGVLVFLVFGSAFAAQLAMARAGVLAQIAVALGLGAVGALVLVIGVLSAGVVALFTAAVLSGASQGLGQLIGLRLVRRATPTPRLRREFALLNTAGYAAGGGSTAASAPLIAIAGTETAIIAIAVFVLAFSVGAAILAVHSRQRISFSGVAR